MFTKDVESSGMQDSYGLYAITFVRAIATAI
jgi:hypothetical protein